MKKFIILFVFVSLVHAQNMEEHILRVKPIVESLRKLKFTSSIRRAIASPSTVRKIIIEKFKKDYIYKKLSGKKHALAQLGFFPKSFNLRLYWIRLLSKVNNSFYHPTERKFYFLPKKQHNIGFIAKKTLRMIGIKVEDMIMIYHLTMVLLGQHHEILSIPQEKINNDDRFLAFQALFYGDAMDTMGKYFFQKMGIAYNRLNTSHDFLQKIPFSGEYSKILKMPSYFQKRFLFPTFKGWNFVRQIKEFRGEKYLDYMYKNDLPVSTEQILHPRKFYGKRDNPTIITQKNLSPLLGKGWKEVYRNTLGEFLTEVLLTKLFRHSKKTPKYLARGWDGDQYVAYRNKRKTALIYYSTWDSLKETKAFFVKYRRFLSCKYPHLRMYAYKKNEVVGTLGKSGFYLGRRGQDVLVMEGIPSNCFLRLIKHAWNVNKKEYNVNFHEIRKKLYGVKFILPRFWKVFWRNKGRLIAEIKNTKTPVIIKISKFPKICDFNKLVTLFKGSYKRRSKVKKWLISDFASINKRKAYIFKYEEKSGNVCENVLIAHKDYYYSINILFAKKLAQKVYADFKKYWLVCILIKGLGLKKFFRPCLLFFDDDSS